MICPNIHIKEVKDGFNEMVEALGGRPLTDEEFKSSELRNQRTGLNYAAMEAAYRTYHRNNGNMLDKAPNGKDSVLFNSLLEYFKGNRKEAIKAKANVYTDKFFNWFGNWTRQYGIVDDSVKYNIITPEGEINWEYFESLMDKYHNKQPDSMFAHGRYTLSTRPENHFSEEKNTLNHIKFVTQSMLNLLEGKYDMDLPFVSEARASLKNQKDLMILAAMFHDVAKPYRHGDIHGWESADILRDVLGLNYDNRLAEWVVRHHMPMPFSHKADFNKSNPEALEVAKNIARDAKRVGIDANTAINAWVLINAADVINGRELSVEDNWAKKAAANGPTRYGDDISVKNVLSIELKEKVELLKWAFEQIKDEDFGDAVYNYNNQEQFDYQAFPEGGREDKKLPYLNNASNVSKIVDQNGEPFVVYHNTRAKFDKFDKKYIRTADGFFFTVSNAPMKAFGDRQLAVYLNVKNLKETDSTFPTGDDFDYQNDGFDGMQYFFMDSESFIIPNPRQIKHVENLGEFSPEDINIYHNLSPNIPEVIPPFPTEGKLGELREKEFALQQQWKELQRQFDEVQAKINELVGPDEISKHTVSVNGEDIIFSERKNRKMYIGNGKSIFGLVSTQLSLINDNTIRFTLLFPNNHIFDKECNYNRINNSIKNNTVRLIYELLSVLKDNGQTIVYSPWDVMSSGMFTGHPENASVLKDRMSKILGIDCSKFVTSEEKIVQYTGPLGEYKEVDFRVVFNIDSMLKQISIIGHNQEIYDIFNALYNQRQERINNQLVVKVLQTKQKELRQKQEDLSSLIKDVQNDIKTEEVKIHDDWVRQMLEETRQKFGEFLYEDLPFNITQQSLIYAVQNAVNSGMSYGDIRNLIDTINYHYGSSLKYNRKTNTVYGKKLSNAKDDISRTRDKNIQKIESIVEYLNNKFGNNLQVLYVEEDDWLRDGRLFNGSNSCIINDVVYLRKSRMTTEIAAEEMLHILVHNMKYGTGELGNIQLFNNLFNKAKEKFPRLWEEIQSVYKYNLDEELVTQVLSRYLNKDFDKKDSYKIADLINKFKNWVVQIFKDVLHEFGGRKYLELGNINPLLDFQDISDIILAKDIYFSIQTFVQMHSNTINVRHSLSPGATPSTDKIRKSAEKIRHRFGVLYKTYEKMPNKSLQRQKQANEIFELYGEIKRLDNFDAVTKAMDFAEKKLGLQDDSNQHPGVLQWLEKQEQNGFVDVTAEQLVDLQQNTIGFFKNLLTYFPPDSYMTRDAIDQRNKISGYIENTIGALWAKAAYAVSDRIVDDLVDRWFTGQDEDRDGMKEVAKDWLHKNAMYGDISSMASFLQNYQYSSNPITKQVFHLIQVAETKTGIELQPISAKISKAYRKANKEFGKLNPAWQKIFMEFDKDGIPTGNFVRDINYGQYQKDVDEFINNLNQQFQAKYNHSYYIDEDGTYINTLTGGFADDEEWIDGNLPHIVEYRLEIEKFKCERSNRRYTFEYYKERMSEPYSGPDPVLTGITGNFKHGLSPKTLSKYNRIQSNINYYMSLCYDKESGVSHPEKLSDEDWIKLESFRREAEELQNTYNADGTIKTGEDYQCAIEIRAWEKWIGDKLESQVDITKFWEESQEILKNEGPAAYDRFVRYNSRFGINPNFLAQTLGKYGSSDAYAAAIHAKLLRSSLQSLVKSKRGYTRDLAVQENNPQFWIECKKTDQIIEDNRRKRDKDFFMMMSENFDHDLIQYTDVYGNAYDEQGNILPNNAAPDIVRMTWFDHMINKYTADIFNSQSRTKPGLYDPSTGNLVVFNGTADEVREQVYKLFTYVRTVHNEDGTSERVREPLTIFSMMTPAKDTFFNEREGRVEYTMINVPTGRFSTKVDRFNKYMSKPDVYDYNSPIQEQPKREYYDNSDAFNKVKGSAKDLYDILTTVCENTQRLYKQNGSQFNYRLPMINADVMMLLSRLKSDGYKNVSRAVFDEITGITENDENMRTASQFATNPDGTIATDVPLKFIRPLEDMRRLSTDISSMVVLFAEMGLNYKNKQQIDSTIKALRYNMDSDVREYQSKQADEEYQLNDNKNATEQFDNMTNIHMYGNDWHFKKDVNQPYDKATVAGQKIAKYIQRYESTHMLGLNILSMLVGACDAGVKQFRETLNGKYARPQDLVKGLARCIEHTPKAIMNIGCPLANNKLTALMQMLRISKGTRATYEHMNWGRLKKIGAQFLMGGFSMLDYMMNGLLLMSHMSNVRLYNSDGHDSEIPAGFYTLYELQQQFVKVGRKKSQATLTHLMLHEDLYNAFQFSSQDGCCYVKDEYKPYINDDVLTMIRTKTLSRGALYNGMNPDNDQPKARKIIWSSFLLSMRGWITQAIEHMFSGGTDNIPITKEQRTEYLTRYGITRQMNFDVIHDLTNEQRSKRQAWNYETGTPHDQIFVGLARCVKTTWRYLMTNAFRNIQDNDPRKVKFSYVEKYACKDALIWFIVLCVMLATWPLVNSAAGALPPPKKDDPMLLTNPYKYMTDVYFPNGYYRLQLADIYFRTIESQISSVDPTTMLDFITSASVLYSAYREQADFLMAGSDLLGMGDGSLDEIVKTGGYINYTKATRVFAKGTGFLDNLHTAFDFYGTDANLKFYTGKYGKIYRWLGYDYKRKYGRVILGYSPSNFGPGFTQGPPISSGPGFTSGPPARTGPNQ